MSDAPLVIFTYCQHYHLTKLAILNAMHRIKHSGIIVMYDDVFSSQWAVLGTHLSLDMLRHGIAIETVPYSALPLARIISDGWIRQQVVKLNLHHVLEHQDYIMLDGDAMVLQSVDPTAACHINMNDVPNDDSFNFYDHLLQLNGARVIYQNRPITFSSVPLKHVRSSTLAGLERLVMDLHGQSIYSLYEHMRSRTDAGISFSEFDIIGTYDALVARDGLPVTHLDIKYAEKDEFLQLYKNNDGYKMLMYATTQGKESIPRHWYQQQGIEINEKIWTMLNRFDQ